LASFFASSAASLAASGGVAGLLFYWPFAIKGERDNKKTIIFKSVPL